MVRGSAFRVRRALLPVSMGMETCVEHLGRADEVFLEHHH